MELIQNFLFFQIIYKFDSYSLMIINSIKYLLKLIQFFHIITDQIEYYFMFYVFVISLIL